MATISMAKYPLDALFKGVPGELFPKGAKICVPENHVCIVVQYGKVVGSYEGDAQLSKKFFPMLEAPLFGKVKCKIFIFPKSFNKSCFAKNFAFKLKDGTEAVMGGVVGYNAKLTSPEKIPDLLSYVKEVNPVGVYLAESDLSSLVKDSMAEFFRNWAEKGKNWRSKKSYDSEEERKENQAQTLELEMNLKVHLEYFFANFGYKASVMVELDDVCSK